jgi:hypothetical protein
VVRDLDPDIGAAVDFLKMQSVMSNIAEVAGLTLVLKTFDKNTLAHETLKNALQNIHCTADDMIWFYYTGHGYHAGDYGSGQFSGFLLDSEQIKIPLEWVHEKLLKHQSRFVLTMFDCCNYGHDNFTDTLLLKESLAQNYIALFGQAAGDIKISSNRAGYHAESWGDNKFGGVFTTSFLAALDEVTNLSQQQCSWEKVLLRAQQRTQQLAQQHHKSQIPHYEVNIRQY